MKFFGARRDSAKAVAKSPKEEEEEEDAAASAQLRGRRRSVGVPSVQDKSGGGDLLRRMSEPGEYEEDNLAHVDAASASLRVRDVLRAKSNNFSSLVEYAKRSHNEDMVMFWALVENYASKTESSSAVEVRRMAEHITKCYLRVGAEREINVSARLRLKVISQLDKVRQEDSDCRLPASLFQETQREVEILMDTNLEGFINNRRSFWKRQVAWDTAETSAGPRAAANASDEEVMLKIASGGDLVLENLLAGSSVKSVEQIVQAIMQGTT
jgi:hypothetical protein